MSVLPSIVSNDLGPLFRLLDDYDSHRSARAKPQPQTSTVNAFQPKFDVRESKDRYELYGELPGVESPNSITLEFTNPSTVVVKGRVEKLPSLACSPFPVSSHSTCHKATIEDEDESGSTGLAVTSPLSSLSAQHANPALFKCLLSERSIGDFYRAFTFPTRVDQDAVKANLKNGILTVIIPKALAPTSRRIQIS